uniref:Uncharacterized protein n=1 Tax=Glossina pallidipes TaxID=7398 RepID=A0A1B0A8G1_GLOPL
MTLVLVDFDFFKCFVVATEDDSVFSVISEVDCNSMVLMHEFLVLPFGSLKHDIVGVTARTWRVPVAKVDVTRGSMVALVIPLSSRFVSIVFPPSYIKSNNFDIFEDKIHFFHACLPSLCATATVTQLSVSSRTNDRVSYFAGVQILLPLSTTVIHSK